MLHRCLARLALLTIMALLATSGLMAEETIRVNFQAASAPTPAGWHADTGAAFGERSGGLSYGWNSDISSTARQRNSSRSPDVQHDTLVHLQQSVQPNAVWEIAVPVGRYRVTVLAGDPSHTDSDYRLAVEGVLVVDHKPSSNARWAEGTAEVTVVDGLLTIGSAAGGQNNKINSVVIEPLPLVMDGERVGPFRWARKLAGDLDNLNPSHIAADGTVENAHLVDESVIRLTGWTSANQAGGRSWSANTLIADPGSQWSVGLRGWENSEALDTGEGWIRVARMAQDAHLRLGYMGANRGPHDAVHGESAGFDGPVSEDAMVVALSFRRHIGSGNSSWQSGYYSGNPLQWGLWQIPAGQSLGQAQQDQANRLASLDILSEITPDQPFNLELSLGEAGSWQIAVDLNGDGSVDVDLHSDQENAQPTTLDVDASGGLIVTAAPAGGTGAGRVGITSLDLHFRPGAGPTESLRDRRPIHLEPTHASRVSPALVSGRAWDEERSLSITPADSLDRFASGRFLSRVPLNAATPESTSFTATQAGQPATVVTGSIQWIPTVIADGGHYTIRRGESLLLVADSGYAEGSTVTLDPYGDGSQLHILADDEPLAVAYNQLGTYQAQVWASADDEAPLASITVEVVEFALPDYLPSQVDFTRDLLLDSAHLDAAAITLAPGADEPLEIGDHVAGSGGSALATTLRATANNEPILEASLATSDGPLLLDSAPVATFDLRSLTGSVIPVRHRYPDGSLVLEGTMHMAPMRPDLDIRLQIFRTGASFADGGLSLTIPSNDFQADEEGSGGTYTYDIQRSAGTPGGPCHTRSVWHGEWRVGR
ncbi:MAG: hypothetical protein EA401_01420 [Planctomycetota bacterium]|nr:MAG: hypothetical protein EA401_01420 [Planctomycetota bacterium]